MMSLNQKIDALCKLASTRPEMERLEDEIKTTADPEAWGRALYDIQKSVEFGRFNDALYGLSLCTQTLATLKTKIEHLRKLDAEGEPPPSTDRDPFVKQKIDLQRK
jgi:hypothetical protein